MCTDSDIWVFSATFTLLSVTMSVRSVLMSDSFTSARPLDSAESSTMVPKARKRRVESRRVRVFMRGPCLLWVVGVCLEELSGRGCQADVGPCQQGFDVQQDQQAITRTVFDRGKADDVVGSHRVAEAWGRLDLGRR